jgi:hypothetical protein
MILEKIKSYDFLKGWRPYFIIFAIGFLLYGQTLFFDFTYFDDSTLILEKAAILQDIKNVGTVFTTDTFFSGDKFYYRPILNLSFMIDAQLGGMSPFIYHLDNILLHCLAALLVFYLLGRLVKQKPLAFFLSLIFLVHPIMTQAVAWLPGRNDSLLAIFAIAAFICFLNFSTRPRLASYLGYLALLFGALLTKETAVSLPPLIIFYFLFIDSGRLQRAEKWLLVGGSAMIGFVWFIMRHLALGGEPTNYFSAALGILRNSGALLVHIGKLVLPVNLSVLPILIDSTIIYGLIVSILIVILLFLSRQKRYNYIIFGVAWFLFFILPSFIRLNTLPDFLEHRLYLSFIGFLIIIAEIDWLKNLDFNKKIVRITIVSILLIFSVVTFLHSNKFSDRLAFWRQAASDSPHSPLAQRNLGVMYYFNGDISAAEEYYRRSLEINPQEPMVHNNLGVIYSERGNLKQAEEEFKAELEINPGYDKAYLNLGDLYFKQNLPTEAERFWTAALQVNSSNNEAYSRLLILQNQVR